MSRLYNLARMSTTTTGSGTVTLLSAVTGCLSFDNAGVQNGDIVSYGISEGNNSEVGRGSYTASAVALHRTNVLGSTNAGNHIILSGSAQVFVTGLAQDFTSIPFTIVTGNYNTLSTDDLIVCNSVSNFTVTLLTATGSGQRYSIKNINTGIITISKSGDTIDGESNQTLNQWDCMSILDYGTNAWIII